MRFNYSNEIFPAGLILTVNIQPYNGRQKKEIEAKIDTGADISVIPLNVKKELRLPLRGYIPVHGAFDDVAQNKPTFFITLSINNHFTFDLEVIASNRENVLIGRDLLNQIILHANGPSEFFELRPASP